MREGTWEAMVADELARAACPGEGCRHRCPACRVGLPSHLSCDPACEMNRGG